MLLVSKCLTGANCRYNGNSKPNQAVIEYLRGQKPGRDYVLICPECAGGLPIPRAGGEICGGGAAEVLAGEARVLNAAGDDYTPGFIKGTEATLKIAQSCGAEAALLKEKSPSCGVHLIHNGKFDGDTIPGQGVCACALQRIGVQLFNEDELTELREFLR